jgi:ABC-type siderophore export system fused ATPase/permease subunit
VVVIVGVVVRGGGGGGDDDEMMMMMMMMVVVVVVVMMVVVVEVVVKKMKSEKENDSTIKGCTDGTHLETLKSRANLLPAPRRRCLHRLRFAELLKLLSQIVAHRVNFCLESLDLFACARRLAFSSCQLCRHGRQLLLA